MDSKHYRTALLETRVLWPQARDFPENAPLIALILWDQSPEAELLIAKAYERAAAWTDGAWAKSPSGDLVFEGGGHVEVIHPDQSVLLFGPRADSGDKKPSIRKLWKDRDGCSDMYHTLKAQGFVR